MLATTLARPSSDSKSNTEHMMPSKATRIAKKQAETSGYSSESLNMLKSKEGQMNAIFALYGSAARHGQLLEHALGELILSLNRISGSTLSPADLKSQEEKIQKKTIGQLLREFDKHISKIDKPVRESLQVALKKRNFLIHHYFLERDGGFSRRPGRTKMMGELVGIERTLKNAAAISRAMRSALAEQLDGGRRKSDGEDVLFTFEIDTP